MTDSRPHPFGARSATLAVASLALVALAGCGGDGGEATDGGASPTASSTASASASASPTMSASASTSATPSESATSDVPTMDPVVVAGVQDALAEQFPALIPTSLPAGWSITSATYDAQGWVVQATDDTGAPVVLTQRTGKLAPLVAEVLGDGATESGSVDLESSGLGTWSSYDGSTTGIGRALPSTAVVVTAADTDTAAEFAGTLITAEDSDIPEAG
ncbi:DUF4245 family protein [Nocardioides flavescens]|uniref:DUF4245 family protein n=1 Tax=Nocardioides flavescens TaxID=2691959 RepID=A0A6L7EW59_9ACTN|nr:DUF4245 family protein [Nocardioides flavescens]MXG89628.1 DUF4245 family protein [Nocardioides flavescens]